MRKTINLGKIIPQKYLDYWTPEDIAEIEGYINKSVAESLGDYETCLDKIIEIQETINGEFATITDERTDLGYWYAYLSEYYRGYSTDEGEYIIPDYVFDELEYPKGTKRATSVSHMLYVFPYDFETGYYYETKVSVKKLVGTLDLTNITDAYQLFSAMAHTEDVGNIINTQNLTKIDYMFYNCPALKSIPELDVRNVTNASSVVGYCRALESLRLKNLKTSTTIGSGTSWGHLIAVDDLIFMIYHARNTGSSNTLTMGSANLAKLANVYVRTVEITDEMRAEDDLIDEKKPFEVCESTDEGAILITDYVTLKNWILK